MRAPGDAATTERSRSQPARFRQSNAVAQEVRRALAIAKLDHSLEQFPCAITPAGSRYRSSIGLSIQEHCAHLLGERRVIAHGKIARRCAADLAKYGDVAG